MKYKLILGVIIPILLIIALTTLAMVNVGFEAETRLINEPLALDEIVGSDGKINNNIEIGEIELTNDYFISKRYDLENYFACLEDAHKEKTITYAGQIVYSEYEKGPQTDPFFEILVPHNSRKVFVEVRPGDSKTIKIYLQPQGTLAWQNITQLTEKYIYYDEIVIIKGPNNRRSTNCQSGFSQDDVLSRIPLVF